jgi:hypothetical protein
LIYPVKTVNVTTSLYHLSISQQELPLGNLDPQWETYIGNEGVNANASCLEAKRRRRQKQRQQQSSNILPSPPTRRVDLPFPAVDTTLRHRRVAGQRRGKGSTAMVITVDGERGSQVNSVGKVGSVPYQTKELTSPRVFWRGCISLKPNYPRLFGTRK